MAWIDAGGLVREIDLIVFDKDGTLVEFDQLYTGKLQRAVTQVLRQPDVPHAAEPDLLRWTGVDPATSKVIAESPLAVATLARIGMVVATVLHQHGLPWHRAETIAEKVFMPVIIAPPLADDLRAFGDLPLFLRGLRQSGLRVAICTSDDRIPTLAALPLLGIDAWVEHAVCGDDAHASKPAPDGLLHLARHFGVAPERVAMVGDSVGDMLAGRAAGAGLCIGVLSGTAGHAVLAAHADVVVADVHAIRLKSSAQAM